MYRFICVSTFVSGLLACSASAQSAAVRGPVAGYIYSRASRTVQPLLGIPGATYAGSSVLKEVDSASIAPGGKWALISRSGNFAFVSDLNGAAPTESFPDGVIGSIDRIAWSADGSVALLYSSSGNQLQRVQLSAAGITADAPADLSQLGSGSLTTLAVGPAGRQMAFGIAGVGLYYFEAGNAPALLSSIARPAAAAFDATGNRLYAADADGQRILEFDSGAAGVEFASFAQPDGPALNPVGLGVSGDGRGVLLADSTTQAVLDFDRDSGALLKTLSLDLAPSRLEALSSGSTFLLNGDKTNEWLLVLDARKTPTVYFVPAGGGELQ